MKQNTEQEKPTLRERKDRIDFLKALLWTVISFLILAIIGAVVTRIAESNPDDTIVLIYAILSSVVGVAFALGAIVAGIVFGVHKSIDTGTLDSILDGANLSVDEFIILLK